MQTIRFAIRAKCLQWRALAAGVVMSMLIAPLSTPAATAQGAGERAGANKQKAERGEKVKTKVHRLAIQVNDDKPETMNLALNNARNVLEHFKAKGEKVEIEIVTFGPGLHMLRDDTSPVKQRIAQLSLEEPSLVFAACNNTHANMQKREEKPITLISEAKVVPSGVVRLMELQSKGWTYIRP